MQTKVVLKNKLVLAISKCMVSMATLYMILKNGVRPIKSSVSWLLLRLKLDVGCNMFIIEFQ